MSAELTSYALIAPRAGVTASEFFASHKSRTAVIRTSDRVQFRGCRRKWAWSSHLMQNRGPIEQISPLWYGTGIHFALEDMFGWQQFEHPESAFKAYVDATYRQDPKNMPHDYQDLTKLGDLTMRYFRMGWLSNRDPLETLVVDGVPQVEVNFLVEVPFPLKKFGYDKYYDRVLYAGTIDRVIVDSDDRLWLVDYKTAKQMRSSHHDMSSQVRSYCWAAQRLYDRPVEGMILWQFSKSPPQAPRRLQNGTISVAKNQSTSHFLYRLALIRLFGSVEDAPPQNIEFLNYLASTESEDHDRYIRRDYIRMSAQSYESEGTKILLELEDMLNPNLAMYPNPTFMCPNCEFYEPCVSMDDGSDWEVQLYDTTRERAKSWDMWRKHMHTPKDDQAHIEYEPWKQDEIDDFATGPEEVAEPEGAQ